MNFLTLSLKSLIFLWKLNDFLKMIVQIFDLPWKKKHSFCKGCRANLWFSFEKSMIFLRWSFKSLISFEKPMIVWRISCKSVIFLWKTHEVSPGCVMQVCVADKLQIPPNDHLDTVGSENAFASKGYVLKTSLSERPSFSRN